jgi:Polyketide cyclase / dehydrase and lipid transport
MASIRKEQKIEANPDEVWAALRDWGALHERLVPGFVVDTQLDGEDRIVTFFNGAVARERPVDLSDRDRRLVWSIVDGPYTHHNGAAQVLAEEDGTTRFVWVADLLPNALAEVTDGLMQRGIETIKRTLEAAATR